MGKVNAYLHNFLLNSKDFGFLVLAHLVSWYVCNTRLIVDLIQIHRLHQEIISMSSTIKINVKHIHI